MMHSAEAVDGAAQARPGTLLLVDDEANILSALKRLLRRDGYTLVSAASGEAGLALLAEQAVDVILSDQRMPGMSGVEFLRKARELRPDTVRMVLSGYTELQSITDAINEGAIFKFLTKPWDDDQLRANIAEAFRVKTLGDENRRLSLELRAANTRLAQLLRLKEDQLEREQKVLGVLQEVLQLLPWPLLGIDDSGMIASANDQLHKLFGAHAPLLGEHIENVLPAVSAQLRQTDAGRIEHEGTPYRLLARALGHGSDARGRLIVFMPEAVPHE